MDVRNPLPFAGAILMASLDPILRHAIVERDQGRCRKCHCLARPEGVSMLVPAGEGGRHTLRNLMTCCRRCDLAIRPGG